MKLKYNFVINEVAGSKVAVAVGGDATKFNGFIKMNETGAEIFNLLKNEITVEELILEMRKIYPETDADTIIKSVEGFLSQLRQSGVLE